MDIHLLLAKIIKAENVNKKFFIIIILVYSDLFDCLSQSKWNYYQDPFTLMKQIMEFYKKNINWYLNNKIDKDELIYYIQLNEGVPDFIESVSGLLKKSDENKRQLFMKFIPNIIEYLNIMLENKMFNPSYDYLFSCQKIIEIICFKKLVIILYKNFMN